MKIPDTKRSRCPNCKRHGVTVRFTGEGDALGCRYCEWWTWHQQDGRELMRWERANGIDT